MGIKYPSSSAAIECGSSGAFVSGMRTPDFTFIKSGEVSIRFYELIQYGKFVIFKPYILRLQLPPSLADHVVIWEVRKREDIFEVTTPAKGHLRTPFALDENHAILVRPDLYTGYIGLDPLAYLEEFLKF